MTLWINCGIIALISFLSGSIPLWKKLDEKYLRIGISFGAGTLLGAAFLSFLPEILHSGIHEAGIYILLGFITLYILEKFVMVHPCEETHCNVHNIGLSAYVGLSIHSLTDGFILGSATLLPSLSGVALLAILGHKGPASFSLSNILLYSHYSNKKVWVLNSIFAIITPIGALISYYLLQEISEEMIMICVSFSLGTFLHIATSDLLPEIHKAEKWKLVNLFALLLGILIIYLFGGHSH
ncbi:MAG: transporter, Zip family protein [Calditrichaeota bacterium]|nr:MAG: transporter, Zip family protein [Calditrichota bacterium]